MSNDDGFDPDKYLKPLKESKAQDNNLGERSKSPRGDESEKSSKGND